MRSSVQERCVSVYFVLIPRVSFRFYAQVPISRMAHDSIRRFQPDPVSFLSSRAPRIWIRGPGVWGSAWFLETGAELRITWLVWFILAGRDRTQRPILNCRSVARAPRHLLLFREGRGWDGPEWGMGVGGVEGGPEGWLSLVALCRCARTCVPCQKMNEQRGLDTSFRICVSWNVNWTNTLIHLFNLKQHFNDRLGQNFVLGLNNCSYIKRVSI